MKVQAGTRFADRYVVTGDVGAGGMGVVVRARDEKLGRMVAIKVLPSDVVKDEAARRRLVREARAAAALDHRGIVQVYDVGETEDGATFIVMELVRGKSLAKHLQEGTLTPGQRLLAVIEVARALGYAHGQGFVHRDIKPDNVMIRDDGTPCILDFGLAKGYHAELASTVDAMSVTAKGGFVGTPAYVSPEQARGEMVDPRTDQFALAVTAFELLAGKLPWAGTSPIEVVSEILKGTPRSLRAIEASMPAELERVLMKALSKNKEERYASIDHFADALTVCLPDLGVTAAPVSVRNMPRSESTVGGGTAKPASTSPIKVTSSEAGIVSASKVSSTRVPARGKWFAMAAAVALLAVGAAVVRKLTATPPSPPAPSPFAYTASDAWVFACPQLEAQDTEIQSIGWLGAAAASLVCMHAQIVLGGASSRTLHPAELLNLPREPRDGFPLHVFDAPGAHDKAVEAAKQRADVWLDGRIESSTDFHLVLVVRNKKGEELATAEGRNTGIVDVVRDAFAQLRRSGAIPDARSSALRDRLMPGTSIDAAIDLADIEVLDLVEDKEGGRSLCETVEKRTDLGSLAPLCHTMCARVSDRDLPPEPPPPSDGSPAALATYAVTMRYYGAGTEQRRRANRERAQQLEDLAAHESDVDVRAVLAAAAADVYYHGVTDASKASTLARMSIQASPKELDVRGTGWHRLGFVSIDVNESIIGGMSAWVPWHPFPRGNIAFGAPTTETYRGAALLSRRGYWAIAYGESLIRFNRVESARGVAVQTHSKYLEIAISSIDGKPGKALEEAIDYLDHVEANPKNGFEATRIAALAVDIAIALGKPVDFAQRWVERFLDPDQPAISKGVVPFFDAIGICVRIDSGRDCTARTRKLFNAGHFGAAFPSATDALVGAERWVVGNWAGAAKAWRAIVRAGGAVASWEYAFIDAFERSGDAGDADIAERLDRGIVDQKLPTLDGNAAYVREAMRAEKKGDVERARSIAQAYVDRWDTCDERPRAYGDMKKLLARLPK